MFVPWIIRRSRNNQHNALNCTTPLFNILAPTYFGSSLLPSVEILGSVWVTWNSNRISGISYNIWLRGLCAGLRHTGHITIYYIIYHLVYLHFKQLRRMQEASWCWQTPAETCRSQYIEKRSGTNQCIMLVVSTTYIVGVCFPALFFKEHQKTIFRSCEGIISFYSFLLH
jgi:hypothetical protein